ncbi:MAG: leucine--tRNA ligase [Candidatus Nealsonbacteria bacterium]|nr:leucine--tRNA ligase [Candidatus Nealsonbacteria bacterium]
MNPYEPQKIEKKWQEKWEKEKIYRAIDFDPKPKFYTLIEFPYPSGAGLHVGHARSWSAMDAFSRKKRMEGFNVLYPIGWDAFGLPAENYALKMGRHPSQTVSENIARFKKQCQDLGFSFDWEREINTTDPKYYQWTQWIFLRLLEKGLAYRAKTPVNWCPFCKTTLADEEVLADGLHERCGQPTEKRQQEQWLLKITQYAQRLLDDLRLVDYSSKIAIQQVNWIGKKEGINIVYEIEKTEEKVTVFTTRPDTNFGATFVVLAPEHPLVEKIVIEEYKEKTLNYVAAAKAKTEEERISQGRKKTGVFTGCYALNPLTNLRMPIWVSDFALMSFGTGAVVGVPGHDLRDFEFAKEFDLKIIRVVVGPDGDTSDIFKPEQVQEQEGKMVNSDFLNGLDIKAATKRMMDYIEQKGWGKRQTIFHLRDWIFSRQHYWGEPIPVVHCPKCGAVPVSEKDLPVELPYVEKYEPSGTGESPLAKMTDWVNTKCPRCGGLAKRETDTMPNWAGSNWYFLRYLDNQNDKSLADSQKIKYWMPVDLYQGGFEHTTLHLLYSRFIHKFLYDIGAVNTPEPYAKRRSHGIVLGPDNRKMSKSFGNVVNPDEIVLKYGADTLRLYEMFMGPFDQAIAWSEQSLQGCSRFLGRVWQLFQNNVKAEETPADLLRKLHLTIRKVGQDLEDLKFNTMVASLMEFINDWSDSYLSREDAQLFAQILAPSAPHIAEEIWCETLGNQFSVHQQPWPTYNPQLIVEKMLTVIVQVTGRVRGQVQIENGRSVIQSEVEAVAKKEPRVAQYLTGKEIRRTIFVPGKLINFVV